MTRSTPERKANAEGDGIPTVRIDTTESALAGSHVGGASTQAASLGSQTASSEDRANGYARVLAEALGSIDVPPPIREFLLTVWATVVEQADLQRGPQHSLAQGLRRTTTELLWAVSAKPSRDARREIIDRLPQLLSFLREGMSLIGIDPAQQEAHIAEMGNTLADAFQSKTPDISRSQIDAIALRLSTVADNAPYDPKA
jgi:hypothetical protein